MNEQQRKPLPIGYWLKRADELLTARIDEAQQANGLTRLDWQILNVVRDGPAVTGNEITETLKPFADAATVNVAVSNLADRNLISGSAEAGLTLTPHGVELYERALLAQKAVRQKATIGISETEYATTVDVLQRLVENLERTGAP